jgi:hypothetical protein
MSLAAKIRRAPLRVATGAFILNSGLTKLSSDEDAAKAQHGMASGAYPFLGNVDHKVFTRGLGIAETALGTALLLPIAPAGLVGAGLLAFSGGLLTMWYRTPGMRQEGSLRPTSQGIALAKDSWMMGIGASLLVDSIVGDASAHRAVSKAERKLAKAEHKAAKAEHAAAKLERKARGGGKAAEAKGELMHRGAHLAGEAKAMAAERAGAARQLTKQQAKVAKQMAQKRSSDAKAALADARAAASRVVS